MKRIYLIAILLLCVGCSEENKNINTNQINGTIITDERGPELKKIETEFYKNLNENKNDKEKIKTAQKKNSPRDGSSSQK